MNKISTIAFAIILSFLFAADICPAWPRSDEIDRLHREALVRDCHNDLAYRVLYEGLDIGERLPAGHVDIPRLKEGNVDVQTIALFVQNYTYPDYSARQTRQLLDGMLKAIKQNSESVELARTGDDVERIVKAGKIALPPAIEGGHAIEDIKKIMGENLLRVWKKVTG